jgi:hypothetical protein
MNVERWTDRARRALQLANQEAQRFSHEFIGTEHVLLGLIKEGSGVAANVLKNLDIDLRRVRLEVEKVVQAVPDMMVMGRLPQTPRAKKALEFAVAESAALGHNYIGTEHLLLGLLREGDGIACIACMVLINLGVTLESVRHGVVALLGSCVKDGDVPSDTLEVLHDFSVQLKPCTTHAGKFTVINDGCGNAIVTMPNMQVAYGSSEKCRTGDHLTVPHGKMKFDRTATITVTGPNVPEYATVEQHVCGKWTPSGTNFCCHCGQPLVTPDAVAGDDP